MEKRGEADKGRDENKQTGVKDEQIAGLLRKSGKRPQIKTVMKEEREKKNNLCDYCIISACLYLSSPSKVLLCV